MNSELFDDAGDLQIPTSFMLPAMSGSNVTYNKNNNIFLSEGYTSAAGNTYFQGIRLSDKIIIKYDFGQGYLHKFINGIAIYCFDGKEKRLISSREYYCQFFSERFAKRECEEMLQEYLTSQMKMLNVPIDCKKIKDLSSKIISTTTNHNNLLNS